MWPAACPFSSDHLHCSTLSVSILSSSCWQQPLLPAPLAPPCPEVWQAHSQCSASPCMQHVLPARPLPGRSGSVYLQQELVTTLGAGLVAAHVSFRDQLQDHLATAATSSCCRQTDPGRPGKGLACSACCRQRGSTPLVPACKGMQQQQQLLSLQASLRLSLLCRIRCTQPCCMALWVTHCLARQAGILCCETCNEHCPADGAPCLDARIGSRQCRAIAPSACGTSCALASLLKCVARLPDVWLAALSQQPAANVKQQCPIHNIRCPASKAHLAPLDAPPHSALPNPL